MKTVVDTNVVAYFLLETQSFLAEADEFLQGVRGPIAPASWEAELANVVHSVPTQNLWRGALNRSVQSGVAVYDTLFVELAERERIPLATFDKKVLAAFPQIAKRPRNLLAK